MTLRNPGRLAIHRRSDEIAFLQHLLRTTNAAQRVAQPQEGNFETTSEDQSVHENASAVSYDLRTEVLVRESDLADELLHTRQFEPLGETLQRRLAMAERICRDLTPRGELPRVRDAKTDLAKSHGKLAEAYWVAEVERLALAEMLKQWWAWLRES
jgi:hypothetical protein